MVLRVKARLGLDKIVNVESVFERNLIGKEERSEHTYAFVCMHLHTEGHTRIHTCTQTHAHKILLLQNCEPKSTFR